MSGVLVVVCAVLLVIGVLGVAILDDATEVIAVFVAVIAAQLFFAVVLLAKLVERMN